VPSSISRLPAAIRHLRRTAASAAKNRPTLARPGGEMNTLRIRREPARPARLLRNACALSLIVFGAVNLFEPAMAQQHAGHDPAQAYASDWVTVPPSFRTASSGAAPSVTDALFGRPAAGSSASAGAVFSSLEDSMDEPADLVMQRRGFDTETPPELDDVWDWQVLPDGLIYRSYLAGVKEPRFASQWVHDVRQGWLWGRGAWRPGRNLALRNGRGGSPAWLAA
jgi:hypothetical protein